MEDWIDRKGLAKLARDKKCRRNDFMTATPVEWRPMEVISPVSQMPFTDSGAWSFIAELLEEDYPWQAVVLDKPPGQKALVLMIDLPGNLAQVYIKVHILGGKIYGRSFHLSDYKA
jgi:hypothetical protein